MAWSQVRESVCGGNRDLMQWMDMTMDGQGYLVFSPFKSRSGARTASPFTPRPDAAARGSHGRFPARLASRALTPFRGYGTERKL